MVEDGHRFAILSAVGDAEPLFGTLGEL